MPSSELCHLQPTLRKSVRLPYRKLVMQTGKGVRTSCTHTASSIPEAYVERMMFRRVQVTSLHEVSWRGKRGRLKQVDTCEDWRVGLQLRSSAEAMASVTPSLIFCLMSLFEAPAYQHKPSAVCRTAVKHLQSPEAMALQPALKPSVRGMKCYFTFEADQVWLQLPA